MNTSMIMHEN